MTTNAVYENILASMPDDMKQKVMQVLINEKCFGSDNRLKRRWLVGKVSTLVDWNPDGSWTSIDRQVRKAIEELQQDGYPILSDSGRGGYWLAHDKDEIEIAVTELASRVEKLQAKIHALRNCRALQEAQQMSLF